jgi:DNA-binding transcriptional regulator YiaG
MHGVQTMSDFRGYSYTIVKAIEAADQTLPGVRLAQVCVSRNISVASVATVLGVSRQTVYSWFTGRFKPRLHEANRIEDLISHYKKVRV